MISHLVVVITTHENSLLILFIKNHKITPVYHVKSKELISASAGFETETYDL
jgi:hypothetical protein